MRFLSILTAVLALGSSAQAATVATGGTLAGDVGGINAQGADVAITSLHPSYTTVLTTPASDWVWIGDIESTNAAVFEFFFDLTGYNINSASLSGLWGVDNTGTIALNGTEIASLPNVDVANFTGLHGYGTGLTALFSAGVNTLTYSLLDQGGPGAFRANVTVTADLSGDPSPVPLPAGAPLMLAGLGALAFLRNRKQS